MGKKLVELGFKDGGYEFVNIDVSNMNYVTGSLLVHMVNHNGLLGLLGF